MTDQDERPKGTRRAALRQRLVDAAPYVIVIETAELVTEVIRIFTGA